MVAATTVHLIWQVCVCVCVLVTDRSGRFKHLIFSANALSLSLSRRVVSYTSTSSFSLYTHTEDPNDTFVQLPDDVNNRSSGIALAGLLPAFLKPEKSNTTTTSPSSTSPNRHHTAPPTSNSGDDARTRAEQYYRSVSFNTTTPTSGNRQHRLRCDDSLEHLLETMSYVGVVVYTVIIFLGPIYLALWRPKEEWCPHHLYDEDDNNVNDAAGRELFSGDPKASGTGSANNRNQHGYANPDYDTDPCRYTRVPELLFLTLEDCDISRRLIVAVFLGAFVGFERKSADRPAGVRTMALVSLGAAFFTVSSIMAFKSSTMGWDASRVTAALPSGVGFLGAALIWKGNVVLEHHGETHQVHGLTTAASLWLSAAIGVGAGGALYVVTFYATCLVLLVLRYGPKLQLGGGGEDEQDSSQHRRRRANHHHQAGANQTYNESDGTTSHDNNNNRDLQYHGQETNLSLSGDEASANRNTASFDGDADCRPEQHHQSEWPRKRHHAISGIPTFGS